MFTKYKLLIFALGSCSLMAMEKGENPPEKILSSQIFAGDCHAFEQARDAYVSESSGGEVAIERFNKLKAIQDSLKDIPDSRLDVLQEIGHKLAHKYGITGNNPTHLYSKYQLSHLIERNYFTSECKKALRKEHQMKVKYEYRKTQQDNNVLGAISNSRLEYALTPEALLALEPVLKHIPTPTLADIIQPSYLAILKVALAATDC